MGYQRILHVRVFKNPMNFCMVGKKCKSNFVKGWESYLQSEVPK